MLINNAMTIGTAFVVANWKGTNQCLSIMLLFQVACPYSIFRLNQVLQHSTANLLSPFYQRSSNNDFAPLQNYMLRSENHVSKHVSANMEGISNAVWDGDIKKLSPTTMY
jgi:hypothetical protein